MQSKDDGDSFPDGALMKRERGRPFDSGLVGKPCKRCGDKLTQHHKIYGGYCGHCNGAVNSG